MADRATEETARLVELQKRADRLRRACDETETAGLRRISIEQVRLILDGEWR